MSACPTSKISVAIKKNAAAIQVIGRANVLSSLLFRKVLEHLRMKKYAEIYVFLESCLLMDSTFLGVLASQGEAFSKTSTHKDHKDQNDQNDHKHHNHHNHQNHIALVKPSDRVKNLLDNLGVLDLFDLHNSLPDYEFVFQEISGENAQEGIEMTQMSLEAHETLMRINKENRRRFEGVTTLLKQELSKPKGKHPATKH